MSSASLHGSGSGLEAAAAEIFIVGTTPVGCIQTGGYIFVGHFPERFHAALTCGILRRTAAVKRRRAGVDEVNKSIGCNTFGTMPVTRSHASGLQ